MIMKVVPIWSCMSLPRFHQVGFLGLYSPMRTLKSCLGETLVDSLLTM